MHCFLLTFIFSSWYFVFWNITICLLRTAYYDTSCYSMFVQIAGKKNVILPLPKFSTPIDDADPTSTSNLSVLQIHDILNDYNFLANNKSNVCSKFTFCHFADDLLRSINDIV